MGGTGCVIKAVWGFLDAARAMRKESDDETIEVLEAELQLSLLDRISDGARREIQSISLYLRQRGCSDEAYQDASSLAAQEASLQKSFPLTTEENRKSTAVLLERAKWLREERARFLRESITAIVVNQ